MNTQKRVMFVDDEEGVRSGWNRYFSTAGFDVTTAEDGAGAIDRLSEEPVDVVVSDLRMPGVDGVKLLQWIHDEQPDTRFILLTGYGSPEVERTVREMGAFEYLNKPISPETLSAVVTAATILDRTSERMPDVEPPVEESAAGDTPVAHEVEEVVEAPPKGAARTTLEVAGGLVIAPLLGLAFVVFLPVIGFGALLWTVSEAVWSKARPARS